MNTQEKLERALKEAMKSGDDLRKRTVRLALAAIRFAEIEQGKPVEEAQAQTLLQKEVKLRQEAIEEARRAQRPDLESASLAEIGVLEQFLPKQLSGEELEALARQAVTEAGATTIKEMGLVMKLLMPRLQGRASGDQASQAVRRLLGGQE